MWVFGFIGKVFFKKIELFGDLIIKLRFGKRQNKKIYFKCLEDVSFWRKFQLHNLKKSKISFRLFHQKTKSNVLLKHMSKT